MKVQPRTRQITTTIFFIISFCILFFATTGRALALPNGVSGYTGADAQSCNDCHYGGVAPEVSLSGASTVIPGATVQYLLAITSSVPLSQTHAGWNVTVRESGNPSSFVGTLSLAAGDTKSQLIGAELAHVDSLVGIDGLVEAAFQWTAPTESGVYTIYFAGNSVNNNAPDAGVDGRSGDAGTQGIFRVTVEVPTQVGLAQADAAWVNSAEFTTLIIIPLLLLTGFTIHKRRNRAS